ncbi:copper chaperone PCu(A)C [Aquibium carbonis]|uniref:Copper chaperone PCu(A)C n=1 Tax=Aquibium carbonis TaxID=2495581 RepID=A0A429YYQ0_9HYPH|nr:copper chaperone PCu(A)C [Aquibium carbonis]RST86592.1 copper chaperone PCu(A)C [Aquibium carbonis]
MCGDVRTVPGGVLDAQGPPAKRTYGGSGLSYSNKVAIALSLASITILSSSAASAHDFSAGDIRIGHPWSRAAPAAAPVMGAYLTLTNAGPEADTLVGGSTPLAERIEIHQMSIEDGVARMRPLPDGLEVAPGSSVALAPGGIHLMFIKPARPFAEGDRIEATLEFARAGSVRVEFVVQRNAEGKPDTATDHGGHTP